MKKAIYAGSFDPVTNGHIDVVEKALKAFDQLVLLVANNERKKPLFPLEKRVAILEDCFRGDERIKVASTAGLTVRFAQREKIAFLVRGLRGVYDFEEEQALYVVNKALAEDVETFYVMASPEKIFLSSTVLKTMLKAGEDLSPYVPKPALDALHAIRDEI